MSPDVTDFLTATTFARTGPNTYAAEVGEEWLQGRTLFGGVVAAAGLRTLRAEVAADDRQVRSVHVDFIAPIDAGAVVVEAEILRAGRSISHGRAVFRQRGKVRAQVTATFGRGRASAVAVAPLPPPSRPPPEAVAEMPFLAGVTPSFTRHFGLRFTDGGTPFTGAGESVVGGWCRHRSRSGSVGESILGLIDAWPSPVLAMLPRPAPASTVTWTTTFVHLPATIEVDAWWWYFCETIGAGEGYASIRGMLYAPSGRLAAEFEQLVAIFG